MKYVQITFHKLILHSFFLFLLLFIPSEISAQSNCETDTNRTYMGVFIKDEFGNNWGRNRTNPNDDIDCIPTTRRGANLRRVNVAGNWLDSHGNGIVQSCDSDDGFGRGGFEIRTFRCNWSPSMRMIFDVVVPPGYDCSGVTWRKEVRDSYDGIPEGTVLESGTGCRVNVAPNEDDHDDQVIVQLAPPCPATISTFPPNVRHTCNADGTTTLLWDSDANARYYSVRVDNESPPSGFDGDVCASRTAGDLTDICYDTADTTQRTYSWTDNPPVQRRAWVHSRCGATEGPAPPISFTCPVPAYQYTCNANNTATFTWNAVAGAAEYGFRLDHQGPMSGPAIYNWYTTPPDIVRLQAARTVTVPITYATRYQWAVTSVAVAGSPHPLPTWLPAFSCPAATPTPTTGPATLTPTPIPQPWFKLRDTSFHKRGNLLMTIPNPVTLFNTGDTDDTLDQQVVIGNYGVVSADNTINITSSTNQVSTNNWSRSTFTHNPEYLTDLNSFIATAQEQQQVNVITNLNQIQAGRVNLFRGNLSTFNGANRLPPRNYVLLVEGNFNFTDPAYVVNQNTPNSIAIIATGAINIDADYQEINSILIANTVDIVAFGSTSTNPLKIEGNLISNTPVTLERTRTVASSPSLFVVLSPRMYTDLLPILSTISLRANQIE